MKQLITTTLPYPNAKPHIGHAFEFIITDFIVRNNKSIGHEIFFNTGIDEHGLKIQKKAEELNCTPQELCDKAFIEWQKFCEILNIEYDNFYRTSSNEHNNEVKNLFFNFFKKYSVLKKYKGYYCVGCESFITEKEIINGKCQIHQILLTESEEENYFLQLKNFNVEDILINKNLSKELTIIKNEFHELSITRKNVDWGVKIDNENTLYIWIDALCNYYLSIAKKIDWLEYWENSMIICGKDNLKFQAYILQVLNLMLKIPQNKSVLVHGTILDKDGIKMSKTLGNVIDPLDIIKKYGISPLRFYFATMNIYNDAKFNEEELINRWNSFIVDQFGNTISRVFHIGKIKNVDYSIEEDFNDVLLEESFRDINNDFGSFNFNKGLEKCNELITYISNRIEKEKPYQKEATNAQEIIFEAYKILEFIMQKLKIIIPEYSESFDKAFSEKEKVILFKKIDKI